MLALVLLAPAAHCADLGAAALTPPPGVPSQDAARQRAFDDEQRALARGYASAPNLRERDPVHYLAQTDAYLARGEALARSYADVAAHELLLRDLVQVSMRVATWSRFVRHDPASAEKLYRRAIALQQGLGPVLRSSDSPRYWLADTLRFDLGRPDAAVVEYRALLDELAHRRTRRDGPEASFERATAQQILAEIEFLETGRRFTEPLDPDSFLMGMYTNHLVTGVIPEDQAFVTLWQLLRAHAPDANDRRQAAAVLDGLSASSTRIPMTLDFVPVLGSADRIASYLRRHDPSGFQSTVAFAVAREITREAKLRRPPADQGMYVASWSADDQALMRRAQTIVLGSGRSERPPDPRLASPQSAWRTFLAAFQNFETGELWRFSTPSFRRQHEAAFAAMSPAERSALARVGAAIGGTKAIGDYVFAEIALPDQEPLQVAFVRHRGEWLVAFMQARFLAKDET